MHFINATYSSPDGSTVDCDINHPDYGWIPTTVDMVDDYRTDLKDALLGVQIAPYVVPVPSKEALLNDAKLARASANDAPIVSGGFTWDMDDEARDTILGAIDEFPFLDSILRNDGTLDWTMADNTQAVVTLEDLMAVKQAAVLRKAVLHAEYVAYRESLDA